MVESGGGIAKVQGQELARMRLLVPGSRPMVVILQRSHTSPSLWGSLGYGTTLSLSFKALILQAS